MSPLLKSLLNLYRDRGQAQYGGEAVSQLYEIRLNGHHCATASSHQ